MSNYRWTEADKTILWNAVNDQGNQWLNIQKLYFSQLSVNQVKFKFYYMKRKLENKSDRTDDIKEFIVNENEVQQKSKCDLINDLIVILANE
ncbi:Myb-like DNA-binding domain-containing protein [Spironucleus salmonicida]|uniref:Myb-like DNA-binding domain-containing protein n=1 Tax=Spironucleus salmonicida TaxID=348837 RepID=V6LR07_9EUKA|nr:Myb-like DNA-binding domain-containing protein [Spironucleus salmonicida]|eukprot:EST43189.1 Myb-like DNA-binding domain-containing protein [Spironucleus salmonicida]